MNTQQIDTLREAVQLNCHISDAQFAGEYTMCVYLLKMRELYRWESGLPFNAGLPKQDVGSWLSQREQFWEQIQERDFVPVTIDGNTFQPLQTEDINAALEPHNLVYSGGLGSGCRPHFFLAEMEQRHDHGDYRVLVAGRELARDLTAPPAMALGRTIFIRRESLRRMIWEKLEEWRWRRHEGALARAFEYYDFDTDPEGALEAITDCELDAVILHEMGEVRAGDLLGDEWHHMLAALPRSQAEFMARAVRDHLADCLSTLPGLIENQRPASLHFYFGNLRAMRRELFPGLHEAYEHWVANDRLERLQELAERGSRHWRDVAREMLDLYRQHGENCTGHIVDLAQKQRL
jgi:hypothetical protein